MKGILVGNEYNYNYPYNYNYKTHNKFEMKLHFVMCLQCGSRPRYDGMRQYFKQKNVDAEFSFEAGPDGSFEVTMDGTQIYSKLETGKYPTPPELLAIIESKK